jgi:formylmethanofuran dehydrogenase subunit C
MNPLRLTLREPPRQRVDLSPLTPDALAGKSAPEIAAIELPTGNRKVRVDSLFGLSGDPGTTLEFAGSTNFLDHIGAGMTQGRIVVRGDAGAFLGAGMTGGTIEVEGSAGAYAASGTRGGLIQIAKDAGDFLAAAIPGDHQGMQGGTVIVGGNAGDRVGDRMRRGTLLIEGNAGDYCAARMVAGTIAVWGTVGRFLGLAMRRGTLMLQQAPKSVSPTFNDCGVHSFNVLTLMVRAWRAYPGRYATLPAAGFRVRRLMGDLANDGRGEILIRA